jgi:hypothetical protein
MGLLIITACYILNQTIFAATTNVDCEQSLSGDRKKGGTADKTSMNEIRPLFAPTFKSNIIIFALQTSEYL